MEKINMAQIREILYQASTVIQNEGMADYLVSEIDEIINHIDNNECVVYYLKTKI